MRKSAYTSTILAGFLATAIAAPTAFAQSNYDTGAGKSSKTTTNSGEARPDTTSGGGGPAAKQSGVVGPTTSGTGASGERGKRPDTERTSAKGAPKASKPRRASGTQTDD